MAFIAGLSAAPIRRLHQTLKIIKGRSVYKQYEELEELMSSEKSYGKYRKALKSSVAPCIPYLYV